MPWGRDSPPHGGEKVPDHGSGGGSSHLCGGGRLGGAGAGTLGGGRGLRGSLARGGAGALGSGAGALDGTGDLGLRGLHLVLDGVDDRLGGLGGLLAGGGDGGLGGPLDVVGGLGRRGDGALDLRDGGLGLGHEVLGRLLVADALDELLAADREVLVLRDELVGVGLALRGGRGRELLDLGEGREGAVLNLGRGEVGDELVEVRAELHATGIRGSSGLAGLLDRQVGGADDGVERASVDILGELGDDRHGVSLLVRVAQRPVGCWDVVGVFLVVFVLVLVAGLGSRSPTKLS